MIAFDLDAPLGDAAIAAAIGRERDRQAGQIELIASENIVSADVLKAQGSVLTNEYAEGYPGKRYHGGCEHVDEVETLAVDRAKALFKAGFADVQPHSGDQANQAVFLALLKPGDRTMGMSLAHGGHLTHGSPVTVSGKWFDVVGYEVRASDQLIDYDGLLAKARETRPKLIDGDLAIVSGGTGCHMVLVDLRTKGVTGRDAERALERAGLTCNKNAIPFDPEKPAIASGVRLGTSAGTTRGFGEAEFRRVGELILSDVDALAAAGPGGDAMVERTVLGEVEALCSRFPIHR